MSITLCQLLYMVELNVISLTKEWVSDIHEKLNDNEKSQLRSAVELSCKHWSTWNKLPGIKYKN